MSSTGSISRVECDPKCGFMVRSHDEKELINVATRHARKLHNMTITEAEAKKMVTKA
jgi:predicted small metal-binding protein